MARYIAISFSTLIVTFFVFAGNAFAANPQIQSIVPLAQPGVKFAIGQPLGLRVSFDRSVYGFNQLDIITNGRVATVEGGDKEYRVVVVPTERLLTIEILADSARSIRGKGNDPLDNGPFILDTETGQVLAGGGYSQVFGFNPALSPELYFQTLPLYQRQPVQQSVQQPVATQQAATQEAAPPETEVKAGPKEPWDNAFQGYRFIMNLGAYVDGPDFINIQNGGADQTYATTGQSQEITLGFETVKLFPGQTSLSVGFFLLAGYHRTLYEGGTGEDETTASYTAVPVEMGMGFHVRNYMTMNFGLATHLSGAYTHEGPLMLGEERYDLDTTANFNPRLGFAFSLRFNIRKFGLNLKYLRLPLGNFNDATEDLGLEGVEAQYQTSNFINSLGLFLAFNS